MGKSESVKSIIKAEAEAVLRIPDNNDYEGVVELIFHRIHLKKNKVITSGLGKAGHVAQNLAATLSATGTPSSFLHPSEAQHGDLGMVHKEDLFILVSNSGKTRELIELVQLVRQLHGKIELIVICGNRSSPLADLAEFVLFTGGPMEVCPLGLTPTTSITCMQVICHILVVLLIEKSGFTKEDFLKRHHGGYLGAMLSNKTNL